jgi:hypothetical protein
VYIYWRREVGRESTGQLLCEDTQPSIIATKTHTCVNVCMPFI